MAIFYLVHIIIHNNLWGTTTVLIKVPDHTEYRKCACHLQTGVDRAKNTMRHAPITFNFSCPIVNAVSIMAVDEPSSHLPDRRKREIPGNKQLINHVSLERLVQGCWETWAWLSIGSPDCVQLF